MSEGEDLEPIHYFAFGAFVFALAWTIGCTWFWALVGVSEDVGTAMIVTGVILWGMAFISILAAAEA